MPLQDIKHFPKESKPGMLGPKSKQIGNGQTGDGKGKHQDSMNQWTKMDWNEWI